MQSLDIAGRLLSSSRVRALTTVAALLATNLASVVLARRRLAVPRPSFASGAAAVGAGSMGALAIGTVAVGALAIGAVSIGALAIARVAIRSLRIKRLRIDVLEVRQTVASPLPAPTAGPA